MTTPTPTPSAKMKYPVPGLTKAQREVFEAIACGKNVFHRPKTIAVLLKKGAIVEIGEEVICQDRFGTVKAPVYEVPIHVHYAWCQWCSQQLSPSSHDRF